MDEKEIIPHLFRTEFGKITAVLCKVFGLEKIEIAEDIASETFAAALETWPYKGVPENPTAWLYKVAKNKARNHLNRSHIFTEKTEKLNLSENQYYHALLGELYKDVNSKRAIQHFQKAFSLAN